MSILNTSLCGSTNGNTGVGDCPLDPGVLKGIIKVPNGIVLSDTQMASQASVLTALRALVMADLRSSRAFPFPPQVTFTDNSTDSTFQTFGDQSSALTNEGAYDWTFQFRKGGKCLSDQLRKFNGDSNARFLVYDEKGNLYGTKVGKDMWGIPANYIYTDKMKVAVPDAVAVYAYRVNFLPAYFNDSLAFVGLNLVDLLSLNGLININLELSGTRTAGVFKFKALAGCNKTDLYDLYSTNIAGLAPADLVVTRNGNRVTVTSIVVDANIKGWTITLDTTDPDYNVAGPFVFSLPPVSVLATALIVGYESLTLDVA